MPTSTFFAGDTGYIAKLNELANANLTMDTVKSAGFTAVKGYIYPVSANITITMPLAPATGDRFSVRATLASVSSIVLSRNGSNINSAAANFTVTNTAGWIQFDCLYVSAGVGWLVIMAGSSLTDNLFINGFPDVWQRGTTFSNHKTTGLSYYGADKWGANRSGDADGVDSVQYTVTSADRTAVGRPLGRYGIIFRRTAGNTDVGAISVYYAMLTEDSLPLAGQKVTLTLIAKKRVDYSGGNPSVGLSYGTGTDQREYNFTGRVQAASMTPALTTTAQVFQCTATLPDTATEVGMRITWTPSGTAGADDGIAIIAAIVQIGDGAAHAQPRLRLLETLLCQRTYYRVVPSAAADGFGSGFVVAATQMFVTIQFPVSMRIAPTALEQSGTATDYGGFYAASSQVCNAVPVYSTRGSDREANVVLAFAGGLTTGQGCCGYSPTTNGYLGWSADP